MHKVIHSEKLRQALQARGWTQKELAALDRVATQVATPGVEVPGRAPDGHAFQQ